ncbi:type II toxin-antitoxin system HipA family toxin YjjJ [Singulisphaera sp. PoT]|uniref:type II toxin-antitoxin system HipA family toxin YjjJ n=1 Tax=Singulisphaera sp. PoT TaxID=3411797 RepID=UPI003BF60304
MEQVDQLLRLLRNRGISRGVEIQRELGISQPVMSRLMREAGPRVTRFGRSVATRYASTREIAGLGRQTPVFRVDEHGRPNPHGVLHFLAGDACWLERESGNGQEFVGLPPFMEDMRPQGYIGRGFPALYPELKLPGRISDWNNEHQLIAVAMRGEDCVGNLIIGEESLDRFNSARAQPIARSDYPRLAIGALEGQPGSSAGGEQPKFLVYNEDCHVLVKFAGGDGAAADRWRDLLISEHLALEVLRDANVSAPRSACFDIDGIKYLEVERFDRVGRRGRRGLISLYAVNSHYFGDIPEDWSRASRRILAEPTLNLDAADADLMVWLDAFGDLIGNTDRHFGNLSFFAEEARELTLTLAPVYDMLPMAFAPVGTNIVERSFTPHPPNALNLHLWHHAAKQAKRYWSRLCEEDTLRDGFRQICKACQDTLSRLIDEHS